MKPIAVRMAHGQRFATMFEPQLDAAAEVALQTGDFGQVHDYGTMKSRRRPRISGKDTPERRWWSRCLELVGLAHHQGRGLRFRADALGNHQHVREFADSGELRASKITINPATRVLAYRFGGS